VRAFELLETGGVLPDFDAALLVAALRPMTVMELGRLERQLEDMLGASVDLVPGPDARNRMFATGCRARLTLKRCPRCSCPDASLVEQSAERLLLQLLEHDRRSGCRIALRR